MKFINKYKLKKRIVETNRKLIQQNNEIEEIDKSIKNNCYRIGHLVVEQAIRIENEEIKSLQIAVDDSKNHLKILKNEKDKREKELLDLKELVRIMEGKIGCPKCGRIYEKKRDVCFCSKCGTNLIS